MKGDRVYIGGEGRPGDSTLREELAESNVENVLNGEPSIQPRDVERTIAIVLGVIVGFVGVSVIAYYAWHAFNKFKKNSKLYPETTVQSVSAATAQAVTGKR